MRPIDEALTGDPRADHSHPAAPSTTGDDPSVALALEEFLAELQAGRHPDRAEFLARHAAIARALAESLDGLLIVHAASPALALPDAPPPYGDGLPLAAVVGDYRLVRELGRGGMGMVYEAEQVSLGRRVALKILPLAAALDARQRERFQLEAQAAAHLHHPHIVPVFAVGSDHGVHYYAMQYVEGRTLADLIRELRLAAGNSQASASASASASDSGGSTPTGESSHGSRAFFQLAARLGAQAAEALDHAHGLGVLHRDIKPSNLMIDARGDLWITDFGLARFQDEEGPTRTGDIIGTLRYMSPEQSRARNGVVDQRADVYSLGATLYELVTLRPVFEGSDRQDLLRKIALDDPLPPRKLKPAVPRDLETILLKALSKEVATRYSSARELADDLNRFLADRPVEARRPTVLDRAAKWSRRHRAPLAAALVVLLVAATLAAGLLWRERQETLRALQELSQSRERERGGMRFLFSVADQIMMQAMGSLASADPTKGSDAGGFYPTALGAYERVAEQCRDDPQMRLVAADAFRRVGFIQMILRHVHRKPPYLLADAEGSYARSLALLDTQLAMTPGQTDALSRKAEVLDELATMLIRIGGFERAASLHREFVAIARQLGTNDPSQRTRWAELQTHWADLLVAVGRFAEAGAAYEGSLEVDPGNPVTLNNLAWLLCSRPARAPHDPARATTLAKKATAVSPREASFWNTLAMAHYRSGQYEDARSTVERAMQLHRPDANDYLLLALVQARLGKLSEARQLSESASKSTNAGSAQQADQQALQKELAALLEGAR